MPGNFMKVTFVNLTSEVVRVLDAADRLVCSFEPTNFLRLRVRMESTPLGSVDVELPGSVTPVQVPLGRLAFKETENVLSPEAGLPAPCEGTLFIVSAVVQRNCPDRDDFVVPGPLVFDAHEQVIGCRGFVFQGDMAFWQKVPTPAQQRVKTFPKAAFEKTTWQPDFQWIWEIQQGSLLAARENDGD